MGDYVRGKLNKQLPHISMKTHQTGDTRRAGSQASLQIGEIFQKYLLITRNLDTVQEKLVYFPWNFVRFSEFFKYQEWDGDKQIVTRLSAVSTLVCKFVLWWTNGKQFLFMISGFLPSGHHLRTNMLSIRPYIRTCVCIYVK